MNDRIKNIISIICTIAAVAIAVIALYCPPLGVIDTSVLWFTAQLLVLVASIIGVNFNIADVFIKSSRKDK